MSADTFTTALFLITAVIAAGVLINAVFPVVYNMAGTFTSATHESDQRLRTDFKLITTSVSSPVAKVWMKNVGSVKIPMADIVRSDVFCGDVGNFDRVEYCPVSICGSTPASNTWVADLSDLNDNNYWDPGETVKIVVSSPKITGNNDVYYQFVLPDGIYRDTQISVSPTVTP